MENSGKILVLIAVVAGLVMFNSCNKNEVENENVLSQTTVKDYLSLFISFELAAEEEITSGDEDALKSAEVWDCLTVTVHENETGEFWPRSWTLDYGPENCETVWGNSRRGKIHVTLTDWWRNEGSLREITFEDYYFNDNKLEGVKTILNTGENDEGNLTFTKKIKDGKLVYADGGEISWECEKFSEQIEGNETLRFADDVWSVTGSGSGKNLDGFDYTFEITTPLIYQSGCFYPVSGVIEISTQESVQVIDYGNGECDNLATTTTDDGDPETIEL
ncbi:MAG TPA: hypothetical protein ENN90_14125 [Mariniphaga anaerophila]|uniref:Uncharacterized protein n=1 Tax=Mariniphaga anaerophila TaxID=1484053 RepID=A0A831PS96_9BACT|nr:hypothetical protein [Mariniphaga anaerophila]